MKEFSQEDHDKFDPPARIVTMAFFRSHGYEVTENPDIYGPDFILKKGDYHGAEMQSYAECEVKAGWTEGRFPFKTVHLPPRKGKFLTLGKPIYFLCFRADYNAFVLYNEIDVAKAERTIVPNKVNMEEIFYDIKTWRNFLCREPGIFKEMP